MPGSVIARLRSGLEQRFSSPARATEQGRGRYNVPRPTAMPLPPTRLRAGGAHFRADEDFMSSALAEADVVVSAAGGGRLALLDIGCGAGRLAYGLIAADAPIELYEGVDVMTAPIEWAMGTISPLHPRFRFRTIDVYNERYNPGGARSATDAALPFGDASFNLVYAYSVFSHMVSADVRAYLREFARVLAADGLAMVTAFVEDDVPDEAINPEGYREMSWGGALHCVRFSRTFVDSMARDAGLEIARFDYGRATDGQSRLLLARSASR